VDARGAQGATGLYREIVGGVESLAQNLLSSQGAGWRRSNSVVVAQPADTHCRDGQAGRSYVPKSGPVPQGKLGPSSE